MLFLPRVVEVIDVRATESCHGVGALSSSLRLLNEAVVPDLPRKVCEPDAVVITGDCDAGAELAEL